MNIVRQLRLAKGIQQKELAIEIGVSNATVSDWEHGRKNPSGERLRKLAEFFEVDPLVILGSASTDPEQNLFIPEDPKISGKSETEQIIERLLEKLDSQPKTSEARILAKGVDRLPEEQRKQALAVFRAVFANHSEDFEKGTEGDET